MFALIFIGYFYDFLTCGNGDGSLHHLKVWQRENDGQENDGERIDNSNAIQLDAVEEDNCTEDDQVSSPSTTKRQLLYLNGLGIGVFALFLTFIINDNDAALFYHIPVFGCSLLFKISLYMQLISLRVWSCDHNLVHSKHQFIVQSLNACCIGIGYIISKILLVFSHSFAAVATIYSLAVAASLVIYYFLMSLGFDESASETIFDFPIQIKNKKKSIDQTEELEEQIAYQSKSSRAVSSSNSLKKADTTGSADSNSIAESSSSTVSTTSETPLPFKISDSSLFASLKNATRYIDREMGMIWTMVFFTWFGVYVWCYVSINVFFCLTDCRNHDSDYYWSIWSWSVCISLSLVGLICSLYFYFKKKAAYKSRFYVFTGIFALFLITCIFAGLRAFTSISQSNFGYNFGTYVFYESLFTGILVGICSMILFSFPYAYLTLYKKRHGGISLGLAVAFIEILILLSQLCSFSLYYADSDAQIMVILAAVGLCIGTLVSLYMKERMSDVDPLKRKVSHIAF